MPRVRFLLTGNLGFCGVLAYVATFLCNSHVIKRGQILTILVWHHGFGQVYETVIAYRPTTRMLGPCKRQYIHERATTWSKCRECGVRIWRLMEGLELAWGLTHTAPLS